MANALTNSIPLTRAPRLDKELFSGKNDAAKLDVFLSAESNGGNGNRQNSLKKIASFEPTQLKNLSSTIDNTVSRREQTSEIREAQQALTKEKVQSLRGQNISNNKSSAETQVGSKIDLSA